MDWGEAGWDEVELFWRFSMSSKQRFRWENKKISPVKGIGTWNNMI